MRKKLIRYDDVISIVIIYSMGRTKKGTSDRERERENNVRLVKNNRILKMYERIIKDRIHNEN